MDFRRSAQASASMEGVGRLLTLYVAIAAIACALFACAPTQAQHPSQRQTSSARLCPPLANQQLRCPSFGFTYRVPFGWVDRTEDMQPSSEVAGAGKEPPADSSATKSESGNSETLLAVFERPPEASGEGIDSAVIIAAESVANYPTIKAPADYFGPLSDIAEKRGLKMDGDPYEFAVGSKRLVRGDFVAADGKTAAHQTSLVMIEKAHIVSFTFVSDSEDEIDDLISGLTFTAHSRSGAKTHR